VLVLSVVAGQGAENRASLADWSDRLVDKSFIIHNSGAGWTGRWGRLASTAFLGLLVAGQRLFFTAEDVIEVADFVACAGAEVDGLFWAAMHTGEAERTLGFDPSGAFFLKGNRFFRTDAGAESAAVAGV
jgi:hypothetical protein